MTGRIVRRGIIVLAAAGLAGAFGGFGAGGAAHAATSVGGCELTGLAKFSPYLKATPAAHSYTFTGTLSNCHGTTPYSSAKVTAAGSGTLFCGGGTSNGTATVYWNNNTKLVSKLSFSTYSVGAATAIQGTVSGGKFAGEAADGSIVFETTTPQLCATTGLPTLSFSGAVALG